MRLRGSREVCPFRFFAPPSERGAVRFVLAMGLTGAVRYLLPVILSESQVPTGVLQSCSAALELRHKVVHNGQREVDEQRLTVALESIRRLSLTLECLTAK